MDITLRNTIIVVCAFFLAESNAALRPGPCAEELVSEADLDMAYESSIFVFVATIREPHDDEMLMTYVLHPPALKGTVPSSGPLFLSNGCWLGIPTVNGSTILVLFLDSLDQKITMSNWQLVALAPNEPGLTWVSNWLSAKVASEKSN